MHHVKQIKPEFLRHYFGPLTVQQDLANDPIGQIRANVRQQQIEIVSFDLTVGPVADAIVWSQWFIEREVKIEIEAEFAAGPGFTAPSVVNLPVTWATSEGFATAGLENGVLTPHGKIEGKISIRAGSQSLRIDYDAQIGRGRMGSRYFSQYDVQRMPGGFEFRPTKDVEVIEFFGVQPESKVVNLSNKQVDLTYRKTEFGFSVA